MKRRFLALLAAGAWFGCSGSQPGPGADDSSLKTEAAFCVEWAEAACTSEVVAVCGGKEETCIDSQQQVCRALVPVGYSAKFAEDCLEAVRDAYEDADLSSDELEVVLRLGGACKTLVDGGQSEGGECIETTDCDGVNGYECVIRPGESFGTCQIPVVVGGGDPCTDPEVVCDVDFYCNGSDCLRRKAADADCTSNAMCAPELRCEIATGAAEGVCVPRLDIGESCMTDDECASDLCIGSTETDKGCVERIRLSTRDPLCQDLR